MELAQSSSSSPGISRGMRNNPDGPCSGASEQPSGSRCLGAACGSAGGRRPVNDGRSAPLVRGACNAHASGAEGNGYARVVAESGIRFLPDRHRAKLEKSSAVTKTRSFWYGFFVWCEKLVRTYP